MKYIFRESTDNILLFIEWTGALKVLTILDRYGRVDYSGGVYFLWKMESIILFKLTLIIKLASIIKSETSGVLRSFKYLR